jgi:hypothetical protein
MQVVLFVCVNALMFVDPLFLFFLVHSLFIIVH